MRPLRAWVLAGLLGAVPFAPPARAVLLAQRWQDYSPGERYEALRNYERHKQRPKEQQREIERQYRRWQKMPEKERERIRENYERYRRLPPKERSEFERQRRRSEHRKKD
jgi:hypothetical protein